jgi:hypothetical protein
MADSPSDWLPLGHRDQWSDRCGEEDEGSTGSGAVTLRAVQSDWAMALGLLDLLLGPDDPLVRGTGIAAGWIVRHVIAGERHALSKANARVDGVVAGPGLGRVPLPTTTWTPVSPAIA